MTWGAVAGAAVGVVGGLMNDKGGQQTSKQELDPRMQGLLYGDGTPGNTGYLNDVNNLRKQQMASGGLNPLQLSGLEMQRQTLMDPRYSQGFDLMRQQGSNLMGQPVAGNPFSRGYQGGANPGANLGFGGNSPMTGAGGMPQQGGMSQAPLYTQNAAMMGGMQPLGAYQPYTPPEPVQSSISSADQRMYDDYIARYNAEQEEKKRDTH